MVENPSHADMFGAVFSLSSNLVCSLSHFAQPGVKALGWFPVLMPGLPDSQAGRVDRVARDLDRGHDGPAPVELGLGVGSLLRLVVDHEKQIRDRYPLDPFASEFSKGQLDVLRVHHGYSFAVGASRLSFSAIIDSAMS